jgi:hypothetical protein
VRAKQSKVENGLNHKIYGIIQERLTGEMWRLSTMHVSYANRKTGERDGGCDEAYLERIDNRKEKR